MQHFSQLAERICTAIIRLRLCAILSDASDRRNYSTLHYYTSILTKVETLQLTFLPKNTR